MSLAASRQRSLGAEAEPGAGSGRRAEEGDMNWGGPAPPEAGRPPQLRSVEACAAGCPLAGGDLSLSAALCPNRRLKTSDRANGNTSSRKWAFLVRSMASPPPPCQKKKDKNHWK